MKPSQKYSLTLLFYIDKEAKIFYNLFCHQISENRVAALKIFVAVALALPYEVIIANIFNYVNTFSNIFLKIFAKPKESGESDPI